MTVLLILYILPDDSGRYMLIGPYSEEFALGGGNVTSVERVGDTVRRTIGPWSPAVHALLRHLEAVGYDAAPRSSESRILDRRAKEVSGGYLAVYSGTSPVILRRA